jgi:hypothetical protein
MGRIKPKKPSHTILSPLRNEGREEERKEGRKFLLSILEEQTFKLRNLESVVFV